MKTFLCRAVVILLWLVYAATVVLSSMVLWAALMGVPASVAMIAIPIGSVGIAFFYFGVAKFTFEVFAEWMSDLWET